jgi:hypothetical protein
MLASRHPPEPFHHRWRAGRLRASVTSTEASDGHNESATQCCARDNVAAEPVHSTFRSSKAFKATAAQNLANRWESPVKQIIGVSSLFTEKRTYIN